MFNLESKNRPGVDSPYPVFFNQTFLCEGESLKVVVTTWKEYTSRRFLLKVYAVNVDGTRRLVREDFLNTGNKSPHWPNRHILEIQADATTLEAGSYHAELYLLPMEVGESDADQYLIDEHKFQVIPIREYVAGVKEMFGESWDEPAYLDSYQTGDLRQLNEFFLSWDLSDISDYEISLKTNGVPADRARTANEPNNFEEHLLDRFQTHLIESMSRESPFPFRFDKRFKVNNELPHIDLTQCFWLLSVLGEAWADALFFSVVVNSAISTSADSLSVLIEPKYYGLEEGDLLKFKMPTEEPIIFEIVREATDGNLNFELIYDSTKGINLLVRQTHAFLSKGAVGSVAR